MENDNVARRRSCFCQQTNRCICNTELEEKEVPPKQKHIDCRLLRKSNETGSAETGDDVVLFENWKKPDIITLMAQ